MRGNSARIQTWVTWRGWKWCFLLGIHNYMWHELSHPFPDYLCKDVWNLDSLPFKDFVVVLKKQHHLSDKEPDLDVSLLGIRSFWDSVDPGPPATSLASLGDGHATCTSSGTHAVTRQLLVCIRQVRAEKMSCMLIRLSIGQSVWETQALSIYFQYKEKLHIRSEIRILINSILQFSKHILHSHKPSIFEN